MKLNCLFSFWFLFVFGCGITDPDIIDEIRIKTDKKEYLTRDSVTLTVENRSNHTRRVVGLTICCTGLQQQIDSHWKSIPIIPDLDCSNVRIGTIDLAPGAVVTAQLTLEVDEDVLTEPLAVFRFAIGVLPLLKEDSDLEAVFSNTFYIIDTSR